MANTATLWVTRLSLDAPFLPATPSVPARHWPHTSHLPSVTDREEVVDEKTGSSPVNIWSCRSGGGARGVF